MTYARARLWLGITGVGAVVVLSTLALALDWTAGLPGPELGLLPSAAWLLLGLLGFALLASPLDYLGGHRLPRRFGREERAFQLWLLPWMRSVLLHSLILTGVGALCLLVTRWGGWRAALSFFALLQLALLASQARLARWFASAGGAARSDQGLPEDLELIESHDEGFTGGICGLPGWERVVLPARWAQPPLDRGLCFALARRRGLVELGARSTGVLLAIAWNLLGLFVALAWSGAEPAGLAGLVELSLAFTLWSFLGLLVLPSVGHSAVFFGDLLGSAACPDESENLESLRAVDRLLDDEPERARWLQRIFHPVPALGERLRRLRAPEWPAWSAWNVARTALFLSWGGLGLLSRYVHCNVGRPALWALPPCD